MRDIRRGDIIRVSRGLYKHYGVYVGGGHVIHYSGSIVGKLTEEPRVEEVSLKDFLEGATSYEYRVEETDCYSPEETVRRARSRLGEQKYDLVFRNCEHFARWCKSGEDRSYQVEDAVMVIGAALIGIGASGDKKSR